ncbi:MAG: MATE family efflux transporter [Bacteroidetes bacterium]|nr:MAG: MATE family efflux transporter [Bacteroidota bacterium]
MTRPTPTENLALTISNRQILRIALPITAAILVPQINFITNNIFLGQLGEKELGVAGITGVYYLIFAVMGYGLNNGLQALIARRAGQNRPQDILTLFVQSQYLAIALAALAIAISYTVGAALLQYAIHDPTKSTQAIAFVKIRIWGLPFLYLFQMRNALLVGTNNSKYLVFGTLAETGSNILFDYTLIFGHFGAPQWGFTGAAWASIFAEVTGLMVVMAVTYSKKLTRTLRAGIGGALDAPQAKLLLVQSTPLMVQHALSIITWELFYLLIEHYGTRELAISNAMRNVFGLFGCFAWAFAATSNTMVSNIIGQGLQHRVIELVWKISKLAAMFAAIIFILANAVPQLFLGVYGQGDAFIADAKPVMRIVSLALIMQSVSVVWLNAVTATGNTRVNLAIELVTLVAYTLYIWLVLHTLRLGIVWGWASEWLYWTATFTLSFWYMQRGNWKNKQI